MYTYKLIMRGPLIGGPKNPYESSTVVCRIVMELPCVSLWKASYDFCGFPVFNTLFQNFARISPECHQNFARMSNWSTSKKGSLPAYILKTASFVINKTHNLNIYQQNCILYIYIYRDVYTHTYIYIYV